jgi:microsomal dipeptidase-like Zn-dependent dipeptidase
VRSIPSAGPPLHEACRLTTNGQICDTRSSDTLEQIDVSKLLIEKYSDTFAFATTAQEVRDATANGKIASLLGIEGFVQRLNRSCRPALSV